MLALALDVTSPTAVRETVRKAVETFGPVDVLVNSAGYRSVGSIEDIPEEEFRRNVEINFFGAVNTARAVLPVMRPRRAGHIVNVSSIGGRRGARSAHARGLWRDGRQVRTHLQPEP